MNEQQTGGLSPAQRIAAAMAQHPDGLTKPQIRRLTGLNYSQIRTNVQPPLYQVQRQRGGRGLPNVWQSKGPPD